MRDETARCYPYNCWIITSKLELEYKKRFSFLAKTVVMVDPGSAVLADMLGQWYKNTYMFVDVVREATAKLVVLRVRL